MLRTTLLAFAATAALGTLAVAPTAASAKGFHGHHGHYGHHHFYGYRYNNYYSGSYSYGDCYWVKKWTYWGFKYVKVCY